VPTLADIGCRVVTAADPYGRNLGFLDQDENKIDTEIDNSVTYFMWDGIMVFEERT
jgi:hypothetical protein